MTAPGHPRVVLFACVHNAGRSQMAAALLNHLSDPTKVRALSAGTEPADRVHPVVVEVMRELGIDLEGASPQRLTPELAAQADLLITMGCGDACPVVPGLRRDDWPLADLSTFIVSGLQGSPLEPLEKLLTPLKNSRRSPPLLCTQIGQTV